MWQKLRLQSSGTVICLFVILPISIIFAQFDFDLLNNNWTSSIRNNWTKAELRRQRDTFVEQDSSLPLSSVWPWGPCAAVALENKYAYIGNGGLFQVMDISNPSSPQIVGELLHGGLLIYDMKVKGNIAVVVDGDMKIVDISEPTRPKITAKLTVRGDFAHRIVLSGNYAYLGTVRGQLIVVDISLAALPSVKSTTILNDEFVVLMAEYDHFLFIKTESPIDPIYIYDVANPSYPLLANSLNARTYAFASADNYLYVCSEDSTFQIWDITGPITPNLVSRIKTSFKAEAIVIRDSLAYVSAGSTLLAIIDVSDAAQPSLRGSSEASPGTSRSLAVFPPFVLANTGVGFWTIDVSHPEHPLPLIHFATGDAALKIAVLENYAYLACLKAGLFVVDVSDSQDPRFISSLSVGGWVDDIVAVDSLVFLSGYPFSETTPPKLWIVNISQPSHPRLVAQVSLLPERPQAGIYPTALAVSENWAFVTHNYGLSIIDISDRNQPQLAKWIATQRVPLDVSISNNFLCLANGEAGLRIFDISNPTNPQEKAFSPGVAVGVAARNDTVFAALGGDLAIFKISSLGNLIKLGEVATPGSRTTVDIALGDKLACMAYNEDLVVLDITDPVVPKVVDHTITPASANGVALDLNQVYIAGGAWALQTYTNNLFTLIDERRFDCIQRFPQLYAIYPNPTNALSTIEYEIPYPGQVELEIFNVLGIEVLELVDVRQTAGRYQIHFNANTLPSGIYLCRLRFDNRQTSQKKVLILK